MLVASFAIATAPAYAAVDRAVLEGFTGGPGTGNLFACAHYMDGSTEVQQYCSTIAIGSATTGTAVLANAATVINADAASFGYTLTNGIVWPFATLVQVQSIASSTAAAYAASTTQPMIFATSSRSLNTAFQVSTTRDAQVSYGVDVATILSLSGGAQGTVSLQYADNSSFTTNVVTVGSSTSGNTGTLTIGLALTQTQTSMLYGIIPAGKWVRLATANTTGTPTFTYRSGQEVLTPSN